MLSSLYSINQLISSAEITKNPQNFVAARLAVNALEKTIDRQIKDAVADAIAKLLTKEEKQMIEVFQAIVDQIGPMLGMDGWSKLYSIVKPLVDLGLIDPNYTEDFFDNLDQRNLRSDLGI